MTVKKLHKNILRKLDTIFFKNPAVRDVFLSTKQKNLRNAKEKMDRS